MKSIQEIFPRASASFLKANPLSSPYQTPKTQASVNLATRRGRMNATEQQYSLILEAMKQKGEIIRWEFEGITLRFAGVRYTPDFYVQGWTIEGNYTGIKFIEIKGRYISGKFERAIERFRHARTYCSEFQFEMHQKTKDGWKQIL
jgi:hypothetical protein